MSCMTGSATHPANSFSIRYCDFIKLDQDGRFETISVKRLNSFFSWLPNQKTGKDGRRRKGTEQIGSLETYWKTFRLVFERATGKKLDGVLTRQMHKVGSRIPQVRSYA